MLAASTAAWSATVYKWVDDQGVVHYSDQPNPKAEKLQISGAQTYGAKAAEVAAPPTPAAPPAAAVPVCVIDSPAASQVFLDSFTVNGHVTLANTGVGSQAVLRMDGLDISALLSPNGSFMVNEVARGEHSLTLQVSNAKGEVTCEATAVAFSVRQRTVGASGRPGVPTVPAAPSAPSAPRAPGAGGR